MRLPGSGFKTPCERFSERWKTAAGCAILRKSSQRSPLVETEPTMSRTLRLAAALAMAVGLLATAPAQADDALT